MGLAISKRLVAAMGGEIDVDQAPGGGSLFWFTMPAIVIREAESNQTLAGSKIALLTRNAVLRDGLMAEIKAAGGDVVPFGYSGTFDYSLSRDADAVLVDAGLEGEAELPAWPYPEIRSIVLLTSAGRGKLEQLRANGFTTYLVKPVRQASLIDRIRADAAAFDGANPLPAMAAMPTGQVARRIKILLAEDNPINTLVYARTVQAARP